MSKKILILAVLVIVLVSMNWFRVLLAQDLSSLSEDQKAELFRQYRRNRTQDAPERYYRSADLFGQDSSSLMPEEVRRQAVSEYIDRDDARPEPVLNDSLAGSRLRPQTMIDFDRLKPFGMELFERSSEIDPPTDIASASDYVLGPGDNLVIYLWGRVEKEYNLTVDREGKVFVPTVGEIPAWGLTLDQFTDRAKRTFSQAYSEFDLTCSLGRVRSVRIYVTGEVKRPGAYTVSALTSLFNALYIGGGPTERGTMRNIKLMRRGQCTAQVDLYKLLLQGDNSTDVRLESGDVIFVPVAGARAAIRGQVKRAALYELNGSETALDLLELAGRPTAEAYLDRVMLERISGRSEWEVLDLNLNPQHPDSLENVILLDGDRVTIYSIFEAQKNMVAVYGQVQHPGYYERTDTTRVSDLLDLARLHPYDVYFERADLFRIHPDWRTEVIPVDLGAILAGDTAADMLVDNRDSLHIYSMEEVKWEEQVYIEGAVRNPGWYHLYDGMTVADLVFLAGSYTRSADRNEAELARLSESGEVDLMYVSLDEQSAGLVNLQNDDHLFVRQIPEWQENRTVSLEGEVMYPGTYVLSGRNETLYRLIRRAGGFTPSAFPTGLILERPTIETDLARLRVSELLHRSQPIISDSTGNLVRQEHFEFDPASMNRIIIDMDRLLSSKGNEGDVVLQPNDRIYIPPQPSGVSVMGAVGSNGTLKFTPGKKVKDYVAQAGNFTKQADKKSTRLIKPSGYVLNGNSVLSRPVTLGDIIVVPTKIEKERDWGKVLTTAVTTVTSVLTTAYIVSNL
ncbi:MAG TPA: SLBB domain-containing protein [candidate division Zixibacteria bacterium]|nr:SLBB domain-containing protein [candidate division Zixibacteria bacterium]